jgi:hypothetical protein
MGLSHAQVGSFLNSQYHLIYNHINDRVQQFGMTPEIGIISGPRTIGVKCSLQIFDTEMVEMLNLSPDHRHSERVKDWLLTIIPENYRIMIHNIEKVHANSVAPRFRHFVTQEGFILRWYCKIVKYSYSS